MRRPSAAIAWQLWSRDRWWITAAVVYFLAVSTASHLMPQGPVWNVVTWYLASPLAVGALGLLAVFSYGSGMDLATCESGFPGRMHTLPVPNRALAGWPMLYGAITLAVAWPVVAVLIIRPRGVEVAPLLAGRCGRGLSGVVSGHLLERIRVALAAARGERGRAGPLRHPGGAGGQVWGR